MVLTVTATTTQGEELSPESLALVMEAVTIAFALDESKTKVRYFYWYLVIVFGEILYMSSWKIFYMKFLLSF